MTVCIAARCDEGAIFCAADRMVTVGDVEMESPVAKIMWLTKSIAMMPSDDDSAFHTEILFDVYRSVVERVTKDPAKWWTVAETVNLYIEARQKHKMDRAERDILKPLGLDRNSYLTQQKDMDAELVRQIAVDLVNYKIPYMSVIVAGIDPTGSHITIISPTANNSVETGCYNSIGYAAIGAGARHASAHFLMAGQAWHAPLPETLWNTYLAKKRSEVAPGVGEQTDLYMLGPGLGAGIVLEKSVSDQLEKVYNKTKKQEEKARQNASGEITQYVQGLAKAAEQAKPQTVPPPDATAKDPAQS